MTESQLSAVLTPVLRAHALELESIDVVPAGRRRLLRIVVDGDGPDGRGPLLDDLAEATKAVSAALDAADAVGGPAYTLEVSSRGVGRPLVEPRHWRRNRGRLVLVRRHAGEPVTGRVVAADEAGVRLDLEPGELALGWDEVRDGQVQVEFRRRPDGSGDEED